MAKTLGRKVFNSAIVPSAPVTIRRVEATPRRSRTPAATYEKRIVSALHDAPLTSRALADVCETTPGNRTFSRARNQLKTRAKIVQSGRNGRERIYSLPPAVSAA